MQKPIIIACGSERVNCELGFILSNFVFNLYLLVDGNGALCFSFFIFYCHFMWNYVILDLVTGVRESVASWVLFCQILSLFYVYL